MKCNVCFDEVGIIVFKISSGKSACTTCMKRGGYGITTSNKIRRTITVDQLQELAKADGYISNTNVEKIVTLKTSAEMAEFSSNNGYGNGFSKKRTLSHFDVIADNLSQDEYAYFCFIGLHDYQSMGKHSNNFAYALTNKRLIAGQKKIAGSKVISVMLDKLNDVTKETGILTGILIIDTSVEKIKVSVDKYTVDSINSGLKEVLYNLKKIPNEKKELETDNTIKIIREYKKLVDEGIITEEEFAHKKKKLLGLDKSQ